MEDIEFIIDFDKYCKTCKHKDLDEKFDPCHLCLSEPTNRNSHKPVYYKEDESKKETEENKTTENKVS